MTMVQARQTRARMRMAQQVRLSAVGREGRGTEGSICDLRTLVMQCGTEPLRVPGGLPHGQVSPGVEPSGEHTTIALAS